MSHIIINGKKNKSNDPCISAYDRGFTLGHGLFETILINKGSIPLLEYHWNRLVTSIELIGIKLPFDLLELTNMINDLLHTNSLADVRVALRLTITDGISERGLLSNGNQEPTYILSMSQLPNSLTKSMTATVVNTRRNEYSLSSRIKSISYLDNIIAKREAVSKGFDEAFLLNSISNLAEGAISNIFIVKKNNVLTPPIIDGALPGVTRHIILNSLILDNIEVKEQHINTDMLLDADEVFITNALLGVKPIHMINNKLLSNEFQVANLVSSSLKEQFNYI